MLLLYVPYNHSNPYLFKQFFCSTDLNHAKPNDMYKWMCSKAYGKDNLAQTDQPIMRASSIQYWKKAVSYFFNTTQKWNKASETGNPTQSKKINQLIKVVKRQETRGNGAEAQADRPFTEDEFYQVLDLIADDRHRAMLTFQYHMIARMDNVAHVKKNTLKVSSKFRCWPSSLSVF